MGASHVHRRHPAPGAGLLLGRLGAGGACRRRCRSSPGSARCGTAGRELKLPMLYLLGFFLVFVIGGLTGVMLAMVPFDWQAHDTHFVVAHLHYVLIGGFIFPMLAGAYYWLPHFTGRTPRRPAGRGRVLADLRRLQRDLLHDAPDRPARHAAAGLHLSRRGGMDLAEPGLLGRQLRHDHRLRAVRDRRRFARHYARRRRRNPWMRRHPRMGHADPHRPPTTSRAFPPSPIANRWLSPRFSPPRWRAARAISANRAMVGARRWRWTPPRARSTTSSSCPATRACRSSRLR